MPGQDPFVVVEPKGARRPILISVPHSGTAYPDGLGEGFADHHGRHCDDTDWLVHDLYDFASAHGITMIRARYCRFVVDLNRDPAGGALYQDGRPETSVVPVTTFAGEPIYRAGQEPDQAEVTRRVELYHKPYYAKVEALLAELKRDHANVLFWDAHSIRRLVPRIRPHAFPDMILGNQDGRTAHPSLIETALDALTTGDDYHVTHNDPFKGGFLTRTFGRPATGIHALQLEMAQDVYLKDDATQLDPAKVARIRPRLERTLTSLAAQIARLT